MECASEIDAEYSLTLQFSNLNIFYQFTNTASAVVNLFEMYHTGLYA